MRVLGMAVLAACGPGSAKVDDVPTGGDADADADTDADADADSDADTDPTGFDADHVLVVPDREGLALLANDGSVAASATWPELVGPCATCGGEGASPDGDGLLLAFTIEGGPAGTGGIARLDGTGALAFRLDGFVFPHDATRDPADGTILVTESSVDRITWVAGDGSSATAVRRLDAGHPDWIGLTPNGVDRFDHAGRSLLVSSHRGTALGDGAITLWDITVAGAPELRWRFPAAGGLDTPHGPIFRTWNGRFWLLWAHTNGASEGSSVGLAVTDDPTVRPEYVADLVPGNDVGPFVFLRGVELSSDGELYLTDSDTQGRVIRATMPDLQPTGASGAVDDDQVFVDLGAAEVFAGGLSNPFEGWLWDGTLPL